MSSQSAVDQFLAQKCLALAGASRSGKKFGNTILKTLTDKAYDISPVHPEASEIDGHKCYPTVSGLPSSVVGLVLVVPPNQCEALVRQAVAAGIKNVWMQQGSGSPEAVKLCQDNEINVVQGQCILMFAQPTGVHKAHRWLLGLMGKLPE